MHDWKGVWSVGSPALSNFLKLTFVAPAEPRVTREIWLIKQNSTVVDSIALSHTLSAAVIGNQNIQ